MHVYDMLPKMSGGGSGVGADGSTITDRLNRQMIGGNTSGFMDVNAWLETQGLRKDGPRTGEELVDPIYSVWIPVPTGVDSVWKSLSRALADHSSAHKEPMKWYLMWLQFFFLHAELSGAPSTSTCQGSDGNEPQGTPSFNVSSSKSPKLYEKVLETYCVCHGMVTGVKAKPEDHKFLQAHINMVAPTFDTRMVDAIKATAAELESRVRGKKAGNNVADTAATLGEQVKRSSPVLGALAPRTGLWVESLVR
jgi:hypothetical protein